MLSDVIGYSGFDWSGFSKNELETLMLNWYGNLIGLQTVSYIVKEAMVLE